MLSGEEANTNEDILTERFSARVDQLAEQVGIPPSLPEIQEKDFQKIAKDALSEASRSYAVPKVMRRKDVEVILNSVSTGHRDLSFS